ncbi:MAG: hypothetical protein JKY80_08075 [Mariprofundaceae bacterium]|nr:hypothetical protein [Mariprofundaceae bacterium]
MKNKVIVSLKSNCISIFQATTLIISCLLASNSAWAAQCPIGSKALEDYAGTERNLLCNGSHNDTNIIQTALDDYVNWGEKNTLCFPESQPQNPRICMVDNLELKDLNKRSTPNPHITYSIYGQGTTIKANDIGMILIAKVANRDLSAEVVYGDYYTTCIHDGQRTPLALLPPINNVQVKPSCANGYLRTKTTWAEFGKPILNIINSDSIDICDLTLDGNRTFKEAIDPFGTPLSKYRYNTTSQEYIDADGDVLEDDKEDKDNYNALTSNAHGLKIASSDNLKLKNISIINSPADGLNITALDPSTSNTPNQLINYDEPQHITFKNLNISNSTRNNVTVKHCHHCSFVGGIIENANGHGSQAGFDFEPNSGQFDHQNAPSYIAPTRISQFRTTARITPREPDFDPSTMQRLIQDITIAHMVIQNNVGYSINLNGIGYSKDFTINNNIIQNHNGFVDHGDGTLRGLALNITVRNVTVRNNIFNNFDISQYHGSGGLISMSIADPQNVSQDHGTHKIIGNQFMNIKLGKKADDATIIYIHPNSIGNLILNDNEVDTYSFGSTDITSWCINFRHFSFFNPVNNTSLHRTVTMPGSPIIPHPFITTTSLNGCDSTFELASPVPFFRNFQNIFQSITDQYL